jgi:mono/diheme cytochrome c family protein
MIKRLGRRSASITALFLSVPSKGTQVKMFAVVPRARRVSRASLLAIAFACSSAYGQELGVEPNQLESRTPDIASGRKLADKLCVGCHLVDGQSGGGAQADVPTFRSIANRPNQSQEALSTWLIAPHAPMPDLHLSRTEIRDLAGFIVSLKQQD